jgi:hypothetical protein
MARSSTRSCATDSGAVEPARRSTIATPLRRGLSPHAKGVRLMVQQGQVFELTTPGSDANRLWVYRYRTGGRDSKRVQRGGFRSEADARAAPEWVLERLRRERGAGAREATPSERGVPHSFPSRAMGTRGVPGANKHARAYRGRGCPCLRDGSLAGVIAEREHRPPSPPRELGARVAGTRTDAVSRSILVSVQRLARLRNPLGSRAFGLRGVPSLVRSRAAPARVPRL